ncbi:hypothetical protein U1Q18_027721 [Sarracenia purpurea var. burkii]
MIPFQILGGEAQIVQIMLKPQEKVIANPAMNGSYDGSVFGPGSAQGLWREFWSM